MRVSVHHSRFSPNKPVKYGTRKAQNEDETNNKLPKTSGLWLLLLMEDESKRRNLFHLDIQVAQ